MGLPLSFRFEPEIEHKLMLGMQKDVPKLRLVSDWCLEDPGVDGKIILR
jgi:hypothetical protein